MHHSTQGTKGTILQTEKLPQCCRHSPHKIWLPLASIKGSVVTMKCKSTFRKKTEQQEISCTAKQFSIKNFTSVHARSVEPLLDNLVDRKFAARSVELAKLYNIGYEQKCYEHLQVIKKTFSFMIMEYRNFQFFSLGVIFIILFMYLVHVMLVAFKIYPLYKNAIKMFIMFIIML